MTENKQVTYHDVLGGKPTSKVTEGGSTDSGKYSTGELQTRT